MDDLEQIFRTYSPVVHRFLLSLCGDVDLAQELTAETFYQAYLHIGKFRGDCKPETWLCQIAKHALYKEQKRRKQLVPQEERGNTCVFENLTSARYYRITCENGANVSLTISEGRIVSFWHSLGTVVNMLLGR